MLRNTNKNNEYKNKKKKNQLLFIENWNGHLYLSGKDITSIRKLYKELNFKKIDFSNKKLIIPERNNITSSLNEVYETISNIDKNNNRRLISIIGDHSNSFPIMKYFKEKSIRNNFQLKYLILDAHPDVEVYSGKPTHEDYLRYLIEEENISPSNIILLGIRTFTRNELNFIQKHNIKVYFINEFLSNSDKIIKELNKIKSYIYLSIDIDVFDPEFAPGTYYKEWCGIDFNEFKQIFKTIKDKIIGIDIAEFYDKEDLENRTLKLIEEILILITENLN